MASADALRLLSEAQFPSLAFCASKLDSARDALFDQLLVISRSPVQSHEMTVAHRSLRLFSLSLGDIALTVFPTRSIRIDEWAPGEPEMMLAIFERLVGDFRPEVLFTYGGDPVTRAVMQTAKKRGMAVVFGLHNFAYDDVRVFQDVDCVIVPSEFSQSWYWERLALECHVLPYAINWEREGTK